MRYLAPAFLLFACTAFAQIPAVYLTPDVDLAASVKETARLRAVGFEVRVVVGAGAFFGTVEGDRDPQVLPVLGGRLIISGDAVPDRERLSSAQRTALDYLDALNAGRFDATSVRRTMDWGGHPDDVLEVPAEQRAACQERVGHGPMHTGSAEASDWTCTSSYNSETMTGTVCASAFFIESNGGIDANTYSWTQADIDNGALRFFHAGGQFDDSFTFTVIDGEGGFIGTTKYEIFYDVTAAHESQLVDFQLIPNPATDLVTLVSGEMTTDFSMEIISATGQIVRKGLLATGQNSQQISLVGLPAGVYFVSLKSEGRTGVRRLIKL